MTQMTDKKPRGRPRISKGGAVPFTASIRRELYDAIDAARGDKSRSVVADEALTAWLKRRRITPTP